MTANLQLNLNQNRFRCQSFIIAIKLSSKQHRTNSIQHTNRRFNSQLVSTTYPSPLTKYEQLVAEGKVTKDEHQIKALQSLSNLHNELTLYNPPAEIKINTKSSLNVDWFGNLFGRNSSVSNDTTSSTEATVPKSFYFWGGTGTGKVCLLIYQLDSCLQHYSIHISILLHYLLYTIYTLHLTTYRPF